jgi:hypothetical protein
MKGRSPAAYALALRGAGKTMKHRNAPKGGRTDEMELLRAAAEEELREEREEEEAAAQARGASLRALTQYYNDRQRGE